VCLQETTVGWEATISFEAEAVWAQILCDFSCDDGEGHTLALEVGQDLFRRVRRPIEPYF